VAPEEPGDPEGTDDQPASFGLRRGNPARHCAGGAYTKGRRCGRDYNVLVCGPSLI
jgi:hypothetical protein